MELSPNRSEKYTLARICIRSNSTAAGWEREQVSLAVEVSLSQYMMYIMDDEKKG